VIVTTPLSERVGHP